MVASVGLMMAGLPDFTTYEGLKPYTQVDEGKSVPALARVSHIHLFGISFIFVFVCGIFALAEGLRPTLQTAAIATPFAFLVVDIAAAYMILTALHQMWALPARRRP